MDKYTYIYIYMFSYLHMYLCTNLCCIHLFVNVFLMYLLIYIFIPQTSAALEVLAGVDGGLDSLARAKICARELASCCLPFPPVASRCLLLALLLGSEVKLCAQELASVASRCLPLPSSPPDLPFLSFWKFGKISKRYFDVFGRFSK